MERIIDAFFVRDRFCPILDNEVTSRCMRSHGSSVFCVSCPYYAKVNFIHYCVFGSDLTQVPGFRTYRTGG